MSDYLDLADEFAKLPTNAPVRLTAKAQRTVVAALRLIDPVNAMMAYFGHHGEISPKSELADAVMNALHQVDPK